MSELPSMRIKLGEEEFEATPENSSLYHYLGHLACYSHVFLERGKTEDEKTLGTYIFSSVPAFKEMADYMLETGYPMHANLRKVAQCDVEAFNKMVEQDMSDLGDSVPDEWDDGNSAA